LASFTFRGEKYDIALIDKLSSSGYLTLVDRSDVVVTGTGNKPSQPIVIKIDGKYYLLRGMLALNEDKVTVRCISKITLKKCKIEPPPPVVRETFQQRWNNANANNGANRNCLPY